MGFLIRIPPDYIYNSEPTSSELSETFEPIQTIDFEVIKPSEKREEYRYFDFSELNDIPNGTEIEFLLSPGNCIWIGTWTKWIKNQKDIELADQIGTKPDFYRIKN